MTEETAALHRLRAELSGVPEGQLLIQRHSMQDPATLCSNTEPLEDGRGKIISWPVLDGISVSFQYYLAGQIPCRHDAAADLLEINYCRSGRIGWEMRSGQAVYLGPGDVLIHTHALCAGSVMTLPLDCCESLSVHIDLNAFSPPALLQSADVTGAMLLDKFCPEGGFTLLPEDGRATALFAPLFQCPESLLRAYLTVKAMELLLYLCAAEPRQADAAAPYPAEQTETVRAVHSYLLDQIDQRITIDDLSRRFLMNPTTLKAVFKAVYGNSLAAHIKEHRMERAAFLLSHTGDSVAAVACAVGYGSPSRFSTAFRKTYHMLPLEYRKYHAGTSDKQRHCTACQDAVPEAGR